MKNYQIWTKILNMVRNKRLYLSGECKGLQKKTWYRQNETNVGSKDILKTNPFNTLTAMSPKNGWDKNIIQPTSMFLRFYKLEFFSKIWTKFAFIRSVYNN